MLAQALYEGRITFGGQHHRDDQKGFACIRIGAFAVLTQAGQHLSGVGVAQLAEVGAEPPDPKGNIGE
jgi:hypothetical protein